MRYRLIFMSCVMGMSLCSHKASAFDIQRGNDVDIRALPVTSMMIDTEESRYLQYNMNSGAWISPYVGVGDDAPELAVINDGFLHERSYQSAQRGKRNN